jgi:pimeloyl-ACP methyl ester carboxylesterase
VQGDHDASPLEGLREWLAIRESRLLVIPGSGHYPFVENPGAFRPAVEAFLSGGWPEGAEPASV